MVSTSKTPGEEMVTLTLGQEHTGIRLRLWGLMEPTWVSKALALQSCSEPMHTAGLSWQIRPEENTRNVEAAKTRIRNLGREPGRSMEATAISVGPLVRLLGSRAAALSGNGLTIVL